jgi:Protein of unknown function (DUF1861)
MSGKPLANTGFILGLEVPDGKIAYNPALIAENSTRVLAVRVESRGSHWLDEAGWDPEVWFYEQKSGGEWSRVLEAPVFTAAEDPFCAWVVSRDGVRQLLFGHVTLDRTTSPQPTIVTRFYLASSWRTLDQSRPLTEVRGMKDIRICQLADGRLAVCGRPKGGAFGHGQVTFRMLGDLLQLTSESVWEAPVLPGMVDPQLKIGSNQLVSLSDGRVGVLGHIAEGQEEHTMHYVAATWIIDPTTGKSTLPRQIATRGDFPETPTKFERIRDVVFPGALEPLNGDSWGLYCGLSDASVGYLELSDPFGLRSI